MVCGDSFPCVRSLGKIFLYLLLVLAVGALVAPGAWHLVQLLPPDGLNGLIGRVQGMPFHRYLSRSLQVTAILFLFPLLRSLRIRSLAELGLRGGGQHLADLGIGILAGLLGMILLGSASLWSGAYALNSSCTSECGTLVHALPRLILTAVVVATLEEFLFRGVLLGFLRQVTTPTLAILASAVIFAGVHFLNLPSASVAHGQPSWWSGLEILGALASAVPPWPTFGWAFATLVAAGVILAWMTLRTGSLIASIGLHGCWILGQQGFNLCVHYQARPGGFLPLLAPSQCNGMVPLGILPLVSLLLAGLLAAMLLRHRPKPPLYPTRRD
jgi:uncharacterized protein